MTDKQTLTICIPTYNRSNILKEILEDVISKIQPYNLCIVVSDNASTDDTKEVVESFKKAYNNIIYHRQDENIGFDLNIKSVLSLIKSKHYWLLGDSTCLKEGSLQNILEILNSADPDVYVVNVAERVKNIPTQLFSSRNKLLTTIGWHMTQMPAIIMSERIIEFDCFDRYEGTAFMHFGIIFEYLGLQEFCNVFWDSSNPFSAPKTPKGGGWYPSKAWEIFMGKWPNLVFSLPYSYSLDAKLECIKMHASSTGIFSIKSMFYQRFLGAYSLKVFLRYRKYIKYSRSMSYILCLFISIFPVYPFAFFIKKHVLENKK